MRRYALGIDGGSTKTLAVLLDEDGRVLGSGLSGSSNIEEAGMEGARASIQSAAAGAWRAAGLAYQPASSAFLGLAGVVSGKDRVLAGSMARELSLAAKTDVDHDCRVALAGGLSGRLGMVLIAGTGSSCFGMNEAGERWQAGGWGHLISDEGSSYWLGLNAMRLAAGAFDGRWQSTLQAAVQERLNLGEMPEITQRLYVDGMSKAEIAALAPLVIGAAEAGEARAKALIEKGMEELAECVAAVARRLGWAEAPSELALVGGLFRAGEPILGPFRRALGGLLPECRSKLAELPPVLGAGLLALEMLGMSADEAIFRNLRAGAEGMGRHPAGL